jgi:acyl carrier protein
MELNEFIKILEDEFDTDKKIYKNSLLIETFGDSSLNILFLRGIIEENYKVILLDNDIKNCSTVEELFTKIKFAVENNLTQ